MPPEESFNRPDPGRQPRPRTRISVDGTSPGRPDYSFRPPVRPIPTERQAAFAPEPPVQPLPPTVQAPVPQMEVALAVPQAAPEPAQLNFTPPTKKKRFIVRKPKLRFSRSMFRVSKFGRIIVVGSVILMAVTGILFYQSQKASGSDVLLNTALTEALKTTELHTTTTGANKTTHDFDLSSLTDPRMSSTTTLDVGGSPAEVAAYGDLKNSYVSYTSLPASAPANISASIKGNWIQMRTNGTAAAGAPSTLAQAGDPRFHIFGPVIYANVPKDAQKQMLTYMREHIIYDYTGKKPQKSEIDGANATRYDVVIKVSELKILSQSVANAMGLNPEDVQDAVTGLDALKGADVRIYVLSKTHRISRIEIAKNGTTTTTDYADKASVGAEPQTKLTWATFAPQQFQLSAQVAAKQPPATLDALRKKQFDVLHAQFKNYFVQTGSYPTLGNINDQAWLHINVPGLDPDIFRDPTGTSQVVLSAAKPGNYAYQPISDNPKTPCTNTAEIPCMHYNLTGVLSTKTPYTVKDP